MGFPRHTQYPLLRGDLVSFAQACYGSDDIDRRVLQVRSRTIPFLKGSAATIFGASSAPRKQKATTTMGSKETNGIADVGMANGARGLLRRRDGCLDGEYTTGDVVLEGYYHRHSTSDNSSCYDQPRLLPKSNEVKLGSVYLNSVLPPW
jgi:hypothetical protein